MLGRFFDIFGKATEKTHEIPAEVLEIANQRLPDNFVYQIDSDGNYRAFPKADKGFKGFEMKTQYDFEKDPDLFARLKLLPREKWEQYLYRSQRSMPVKNTQMGNAEKLVSLEMLMSEPYGQEVKITDMMMYPSKFPEPIKMVFESPEGDKAEISIQQQPYDNLMEIKFANVDFPALSVTIYKYSPLVGHSDDITHSDAENPVRASYSIHTTKAESAKEVVTALHIFRGLHNGTTKVDGNPINPQNGFPEYDIEKLNSVVEFWEKALQLERILKVSFQPGADFPQEDVVFFAELVTCLLEKRAIYWEHPFNHFHVHDCKANEKGKTYDDYIGKNNIQYRFLEGPNNATLLGTEFTIYSKTIMKGFIISDVDWDDEKKQSGEIYITDGIDGPWTLSRLYITEEEAMTQEKLKKE